MKKVYLVFIMFIVLIVYSFGDLINIRADQVVGGDERYVLRNNVQIRKGDLNIITEHATVSVVNDDWRSLVSSETTIIGSTFETRANKVDFDLQTEKGTLSDNVSTIITIDDSDMSIESDILIIDNRNNIYEGSAEEQVLIIKDDYTITADSFTYDENKKELLLEGNVRIINLVRRIDMKSQVSIFYTETNEIEARQVELQLETGDGN